MRSITFILGTPYCGSTFLASELDRSGEVFNIGELDRVSSLGKNENPLDTHWCESCQLDSEICPVFTEDLINRIRSAQTYLEIYKTVSQVNNSQFLLDGSKHACWLNAACKESAIRELARPIVLTRHPVSFALSSHRRHQDFNRPFWKWFEIWRDTYYDILRTCSTNQLQYLIVRHEDLCANPSAVLAIIQDFMGQKQHGLLVGTPSRHYIGGNPEFAKKIRDEASSCMDFSVNRQDGEDFLLAREFLFSTPGLFDLYRNVFGYT